MAAPQNLPGGGGIIVAFANELFDGLGEYASPTFTAAAPGYYFFGCQVDINSAAPFNQRLNAQIEVNGAIVAGDIRQELNAISWQDFNPYCIVQLAAGDTVQVRALNAGVGARTVSSGWFFGYRLS